jgi:archaemetzincin
MNPEAASLVCRGTIVFRLPSPRALSLVVAALLGACDAAPAPPALPSSAVSSPVTAPDTAAEVFTEFDTARAPAAALEASWTDTEGFEPMPEAQAGEWLARFDESHVPFERYVEGDPVRPDAEQRTLAFIPAGPFVEHQQAVMDATIEFCGLWFDLPTATLPPMAVPTDGLTRVVLNGSTDESYTQVHTAYFLRQALPRKLPDNAVTLVAVTMSDLYPGEGWNYVFGQALLRGRVGVYSLVRHFPEFWDEPDSMEARRVALRRSLKLVSHEVGHTFGLEHCVTWRCNMNGSNSLTESDRAPLHLCPDCLRKLQWNCEFDVIDRYERLRAFFVKYELHAEAEWIATRVERIRTAAALTR